MIALADLKNKTSDEVRNHLAIKYSSKEFESKFENYGKPDPKITKRLNTLDILLAYESVGSYGCDSSSFFLFKDKNTQTIFELHGSHCSCYGFEGQFELSESSIKSLKLRAENGFYFTGGYDDEEDQNKKIVYEFINTLNG